MFYQWYLNSIPIRLHWSKESRTCMMKYFTCLVASLTVLLYLHPCPTLCGRNEKQQNYFSKSGRPFSKSEGELWTIHSGGTRTVVKSSEQGGEEGALFDDLLSLDEARRLKVTGVQSVNLTFDDKINSIQVTYQLSDGSSIVSPIHGKMSGSNVNFSVEPGEYIIKVEGQTNEDSIYQVTFTTTGPDYTTNTFGPFGRKSGTLSFSFQNAYIVGFHGRSSEQLNSIGVHSLPFLGYTGMIGNGYGGTQFDDRPDRRVPPIIGINTINLWYDSFIFAIQFEYALLGNTTFLTEKRGGEFRKQNFTIIQLRSAENDHLSGITMMSSALFISGIGFYTVDKSGNSQFLGPYGTYSSEAPTTSTSRHDMIVGFSGFFRPNTRGSLANLGAYYTDGTD